MRIVKVKSIPNVDNERLVDSVTQICEQFHGDGLRFYDGPRRGMYDNCVKIKPIMRELISRNQPNPRPECVLCSRRFNEES